MKHRTTMSTISTIELAREVKITPKSIRLAIRRGDLLATRISKGLGRSSSATEFVISRSAADDWKARRKARISGVPYAKAAEAQGKRRKDSGHAFFMTKDDEEDEGHCSHRITVLKQSALEGDERAREQLKEPWERGGVALTRWWRDGVGEII